MTGPQRFNISKKISDVTMVLVYTEQCDIN